MPVRSRGSGFGGLTILPGSSGVGWANRIGKRWRLNSAAPIAAVAILLAAIHPAAGQAPPDRAAAAQAAKAAFVFQAQETRSAMLAEMDDDLILQRKRAESLALQVASLKTELQKVGTG